MIELSQTAALASVGYGPILVLIALAIVIATAILLITHILPKPLRHGPVKEDTYESGVPLVGDARQRFNVRFYLVAMLFLLFDVELIFMYPWALVFFDAKNAANAQSAGTAGAGELSFLFAVMAIFFVLLLIGFIYDWGKGVFRYD
jgi:NADH-quinone oxidoreductase subunit A